ncbi:MAG TPA: hypothetical protein VN685_11360, partial [Rhizomicrobium sp.]|nr:hypothetical protein [Rhizomicrobium sp.]
ELHNASREDYTKLHERMRAAGFNTTIKGSNGLTYHLPPAEYRYEGYNMTSVQVRDKASAVAATVKPSPAIFVTEGANCAWTGLEQVSVAA